MYGGGNDNVSGHTRTITSSKGTGTLHISPHIAAHKSAVVSSQVNSLSPIESREDDNSSVASHVTVVQTSTSNVPVYKYGITTSNFFKGNADIQTTDTQFVDHVRASFTQPQDLSAHTNKYHISTSTAGTPDMKAVSDIQSVDSISGPVIVTERPKSPLTYYRLVDGTTISISGQHATVPIILSSVNDNIHGSSYHDSIHTIQAPVTVSTGLSVGSLASHHHSAISGIQEGHIVLPEVITTSYISNSDHLIPERQIPVLRNPVEVKQENDDHKDLVRQALQEAVVQNSHNRLSPTSQVMDYNYGTEEIGELLMMNINVNSNSNKMTDSVVVGSDVSDIGNSGQVVVLHPTATYDDSGNDVTSPLILTARTKRRPKLTDEARAIRRVQIANRMREKRATESEEQKERRRMREAERMRRKRAEEDLLSKERRRKEAAERARLRRSKLSEEEREMERQKAAARMRMRRQNENEEQKRLRRLKAAERMRKRRATETPEQRENRKQGIAMRMKVRRKKKEDVEKLKTDSQTTSIDDRLCPDKRINSVMNSEFVKEVIDGDAQTSHSLQGQHIVLSSNIQAIHGNVTVLQGDNSSVDLSQVIHGAIVSAESLGRLELVQHQQPLSLQVRSLSPLSNQQAQINENEREPPPSYHKGVLLVSEAPVTSLPQAIYVQSKSIENSSPSSQDATLQKGGTHHHLPHILHNLAPQHDSHYHHHPHSIHSTYIIPHVTVPVSSHPNSSSPSQSVQIRQQ